MQPGILEALSKGKGMGKEGRKKMGKMEGALEESIHMWNKGPKIRCLLTKQRSEAQNIIQHLEGFASVVT